MYCARSVESSLFVKRHCFLRLVFKCLVLKVERAFDFLNSENAMRRAAVQECGMVFLYNVRHVHSQDIFQSHINIDLTTMKCRSQLNIS